MKRSALILGITCLASIILQSCSYRNSKLFSRSEGDDEDLQARNAYEQRLLADPATGQIPYHIREKELAFAATLPVNISFGNSMSKTGAIWQQRGPWNVGGRTLAIGIDITNEKVILAGGATGGIWRSIDSGITWKRVTDPIQEINISCILQNKTRGKRNIWYAGTGENFGNLTTGGRNPRYLGNGILKSIDSGKTWSKLAGTGYNEPQSFKSDFDYIFNLGIDTNKNILYAAIFGEINKSTDDGKTWLPQNNTHSGYTDLAVTSTGIIYIYRSSSGKKPGIFRSTDGTNYTNITPSSFPSTYGSMTLCIDPNNENTLYIFGNTPNYGKQFNNGDWASLWKYRYITGDGSGSNGVWTDLTGNLPSDNSQFGSVNTQNGSNVVIKVKPGDSNTVFIGATNLYRSTDAFSTTKNFKVIGGYNVVTSGPGYHDYPNHHPDQHALVFYPSNPDKMLSGCDGGIFRTDNNTDTGQITWIPLNHGYLTTQFYSAATNHDSSGDTRIIGGLQDNGTYFCDTTYLQSNWDKLGSSDGCYCFIANNAKDYYISAQNGIVYRIQLNSANAPYKWARLDPANSTALFVNPYTIDPNNQKRMYYVRGFDVLINNDVTQYALQNKIPSKNVTTGWTTLTTLDTTVSALSVSISPGDRLVCASARGSLYRIDNASSASPKTTTITGTNFPAGGYINSIAMSPTNADEMLVVFSNYSIPSLFYTSDAGKTWTDVSANLEQFPDGTGNGPSCRWASILPVGGKYVYFIGTSTGLYTSDSLNGSSTIWTQQDSGGIANNIVTMIDTRISDGYVAIATYGGGMYTTTVNSAGQVTGIENTANTSLKYGSFKLYPNPLSNSDVLTIGIEDEKSENITIEILSDEGKLVLPGRSEKISSGINNLQIRMPSLTKGIYYVSIHNDKEKLSRTLVVQ